MRLLFLLLSLFSSDIIYLPAMTRQMHHLEQSIGESYRLLGLNTVWACRIVQQVGSGSSNSLPSLPAITAE
jgi:hypothetical protein